MQKGRRQRTFRISARIPLELMRIRPSILGSWLGILFVLSMWIFGQPAYAQFGGSAGPIGDTFPACVYPGGCMGQPDATTANIDQNLESDKAINCNRWGPHEVNGCDWAGEKTCGMEGAGGYPGAWPGCMRKYWYYDIQQPASALAETSCRYGDPSIRQITFDRCACPPGTLFDRNSGRCVRDAWLLDQTCKVGHPVNPATGMKVKEQVDYAGAGAAPLSFVRRYISDSREGWSHNWSRSLDLSGLPYVIWARGGASDRVAFYDNSLSGKVFSTSRPSRDKLLPKTDALGVVIGWSVKRFDDDAVEQYDTTGKLLSITHRNGWRFELRYTGDRIDRVMNPFGRTLRFRYDSLGRISRIIDPANGEISYRYDKLSRLVKVVWQDKNQRTYHYEDLVFPDLLTGISDELGVRAETYRYDTSRRVIETSLHEGNDLIRLAYTTDLFGGPQTEVIEYTVGRSTTRTYNFSKIAGAISWSPKSVSAPCNLCGSTAATSLYTSEGWLFKSTGYDDSVIFFKYDTSGRPIEKATFPSSFKYSDSRPPLGDAIYVTSIRWHPVWNLPEAVSEPRSIFSYTYDDRGNLRKEVWSATNDLTGSSGLSAPKVGSTFESRWIHDGANLMTSAQEYTDGSLTGDWIFAYDTTGLGQVRTVTDVRNSSVGALNVYDGHGRVTEAVSDQGVALGYRYGPRGFMTQAITSGQTVKMEQNAVGLTTDALMPDGQSVRYIYDPSHRLVEVQINGLPVSMVMMRDGPVPRDRYRGWWVGRLAAAKRGLESLIPAAIAQVPAPPPLWPVVPIPGDPQPGQPYIDPATNEVVAMSPMSDSLKRIASIWEQMVRSCQCDPKGGYNKPTLTPAAYSHLFLRGHLGILWTNQSYFTEAVTQQLIDEAVAKGTYRRVNSVAIYTVDFGRVIGMTRTDSSSPVPFAATSRALLFVETSNCNVWERKRNEVITFHPVPN